MHKTTSGGINALAVKAGDDNIIATASNDHTVAIFDKSTSQRVQQLIGHSKKVLDAKFMETTSFHAAPITLSSFGAPMDRRWPRRAITRRM